MLNKMETKNLNLEDLSPVKNVAKIKNKSVKNAHKHSLSFNNGNTLFDVKL